MNHLTSTQIQEYLDSFVGDPSLDEIEFHLRTCPECQSKLKALKHMAASLRRFPLDRVSPNFTERVIKRLRIKESPSFVWTIFKNIAPLFALILVVGLVFVALQFAGAFSSSTLQQPAQQTQSVYSQVSGKVTSVIGVLSDWLSKYFSFAFAKSTYGLTVFLIVFFSVVALVDKFFLMPMIRKRG